MTETIHDSFVLERTYPQAPARVFAAFADPAKKRRWFADGGGDPDATYELDFKVGGAERSAYKITADVPVKGLLIVNEARFQDIVENARVVFTQVMELGGRRISAALVTFELSPAGTGTKVVCTHHAAFFEGADGPKMRKAGWETLVAKLGASLADA